VELRLCVTTVGKQLQLLVATISCRRFSCTLTTSAPSPSSSSDSCWTPSPVCAALALTPCAAPPCRARNISTYSRLASTAAAFDPPPPLPYGACGRAYHSAARAPRCGERGVRRGLARPVLGDARSEA